MRFEDVSSFPGEGVFYEMDRAAILRKDTKPFLEFFDIERIAAAKKLHALLERVSFAVAGFDGETASLHEIIEVRTYLQYLVQAWPYFFYVDALEDNFLSELILCLVPQITSLRTADSEAFVASVSPQQLNAACLPLFNGLRHICSLDHQMDQHLFDQRIAQVSAYLHHNQAGGATRRASRGSGEIVNSLSLSWLTLERFIFGTRLSQGENASVTSRVQGVHWNEAEGSARGRRCRICRVGAV